MIYLKNRNWISTHFGSIFFTLFLWPGMVLSQIDISGQWNGVVGVPLGEDLISTYEFRQSGLIIEGFQILKSKDGKDSSKVKILGTVDGNAIQFKSTEFIYKTDNSCLSESNLRYTSDGNQEKLTGKWKGDWSLSTCPPGTKGIVELVKLKNENPSISKSIETTSVLDIESDDEDGVSLFEELQQRKYFALIIGINEYESEGIQDLDHPIADAGNILKILKTNYTFQENNIRFLKNPTRDEIINAFDEFNSIITNKDQLLIFYAGHGIWDSQLNQGYWLPSDASKDSKARWLSNSTIRDYVGGIKTKHTLLITDACFSGGIFKERGVTFENSKAILEMYKLKSRKAMTSGTLNTVPDKSVFIKYLAQSLLENDQPLLSTEDLFRSFKIAVINNSPNGQVPQYGPILQAGDEGGDFIFFRKNIE